MNRLGLFGLFVALSTLGCGGGQKVEDAPPAPKPVVIDGDARLGEDVVPQRYRLDLTLDPSKEVFSGAVAIDVTVAKPTHVIYLHGADLTIISAKVVRDGQTFEAEARSGENDGLALVFAPELPAGPGTIEIAYEAPLDEVPTGLYRVQDGGAWYAFTQFEPLEARQAFPSFDEPRFKTPFEVTMRVPRGQLALTNTPEVARETQGEQDVFRFAESKPLPTYLVAFAAGTFDVVEAPADAIAGVPLRLIATRGKGELGRWMLGQTPALLADLSEYFAQPYPFQKLDIIAVPNFSAGAMENVGLVTFRETLLLIDPATASIAERRSAMSVMAHELAHMWFGNLVTMPWWDDLWLNEAFATWMARRVLNKAMPELEVRVDSVAGMGWLVDADSKSQSRAIRQPIQHSGDVYNAFDGITYSKGANVLGMFEAWMGEEVFRDAIRSYMAAHPYGSATTADLLAAFDKASGKPVSKAMATFLDQPGAPLLEVAMTCDEGVRLTVSQSRYLPAQSKAENKGMWNVPFCVTYPDGKETKTFCELLDAQTGEFELPAAKCPAWVYPNANQVGYYRWNLPAEGYAKLLEARTFKKFDDATKVDVFTNTTSLAVAEAITAEQYFDVIEAMADERQRVIVRKVVAALYALEPLVTEETRKKFQRRATRILRPHLRRVGYEPAANEAVEDALLRPTLVSAAAFLADDAKARAAAEKAAKRFLEDQKAVRSDVVKTSLPIAAWRGEAGLWLSYQMALQTSATPAARAAVISGLGSFTDADLLKRSLGLFLDGTLRAQDMWTLVGPSFDRDATYAVTWDWFTSNFDAIVKQVGNKAVGRLPSLGRGFCTVEGRQKVEAFFADPARREEGTERNLASTLESIDQCVRRREYMAPALANFLD